MLDLGLGIDAQAWATLHAFHRHIGDYDYPDLVFQTYALYNGRERGICIVVSKRDGYPNERLLLLFGEDRRSDSLFVWEQETPNAWFDVPRIEDFKEDSYKARTPLPTFRADLAVRTMQEAIKKWMEKITKG